MAKSARTSECRIIQIGADKVTISGEKLVIDARLPLLDWQVRELNPVPVYFEERKYLLVQKVQGQAPFAVRYLLTTWPADVVSSSTRFHTYDDQTVAERDGASRRERSGRVLFLFLLPFYPFLGFLWSAAQNRFAYFGFAPRSLTRFSIGTLLFFLIPGIVLWVLLAGAPGLVLYLAFLLILAGLLDALMRSHFYLRDEGWCGGFFEWLLAPVRELSTPSETRTPGFWASLEILLWDLVEKAPSSRKNLENTSALRLPAVIERELRVALRKQKPARRRLRLAAGCTAAALLLTIITGNSAGRNLHALLCVAGFYVVLTTPQRIAGLFSTERQEQTLGLLFMSGLSASEVFLSKTISAVAIVFSDLMAVTPMLALPFLMGGVSFELFFATVCCLPNVLLWMLAISLLGSVLCEDEGTALFVTVAIGISMTGLPLAIYLAQKFLSSGNQTSNWLLMCNPAYGPWLIFKRFSTGQALAFWRNYFITFSISLSCFSVAAFFLQRLWRQREERGLLYRWRERWATVFHGDFTWRKRLATEYLDKNPCVWLAARDRAPIILTRIALSGIALVWLICWALWPLKWPSVANLFITAVLLNMGVRWMIHYMAAGLGLARRDGSYELLLTTPLIPREIVDGQLGALRCCFRQIGRSVLVVEIVMMFAGLFVRKWEFLSLLVYFILWAALLFWNWEQSWNFRRAALSMWAGLNSGRSLKAVWRATGFRSWVWVWFLFSARHVVSSLAAFPSGSFAELLLASAFLTIVIALFISSLSNTVDGNTDNILRRLVAEFREIVREPLPYPRDPRFKEWNIRERFPWGWELAQDQLHERLVRRSESLTT